MSTDEQRIKDFYLFVCKSERIKPIGFTFSKKARKYDGVMKYVRGGRPVGIELNKIEFLCNWSVFVVLHEVAHYIQYLKNMNPTHDKRFRSELERLVKTYEKTPMANGIVW